MFFVVVGLFQYNMFIVNNLTKNKPIYHARISKWEMARVGKILTARDFPCGKSRDFPGWEIPSKFGKLGNT